MSTVTVLCCIIDACTNLITMTNRNYNLLCEYNSRYGWTAMSTKEFNETAKLVSARITKLKKTIKFDALAFSGSSGCAIAFAVAAKHKLPLMYIRKKGEKSHSTSGVECSVTTTDIKKYLIVDDFVDSGATIDHIINTVTRFAKNINAYPAKPAGILCYDGYHDRDRDITTPGNHAITIYSAN